MRVLLILLVWLLAASTTAQINPNKPKPKPAPIVQVEEDRWQGPVHFWVEKLAEFPGGQTDLEMYLNKSLAERVTRCSGVVYVTFVVEPDGTLDDIGILKGVGDPCDKEVLQVVALMPNWIPGESNGEKVRVQYNLPVPFHSAR